MSLWSRIRNTLRGDRLSDEIQEELRFHLDMDAAGRVDPREARVRLGNITRIAEETRAVGIIPWLESALQDARYGVRQLRRTPALTAAVVLSLAIGMGANTAMFSLVNAALLRPLPVSDPDSLVIVEWIADGFPPGVTNINGDFRRASGDRHQGSSVGANVYRHLAREQQAYAALIGIADPETVAIQTGAAPVEQVSLQYVSGNFFQGLGVLPVIGRPFRIEEDQVGQDPVVIVSQRFWSSRFGSDDIADRDIRINNVPAHIVGVAPSGFFGVMAGQWTDVYAPLGTKVAFQPRRGPGAGSEDDTDWWVRQMARLKPGMPDSVARAQINPLFRQLAAVEGPTVAATTIPDLVTLPGRRGFDGVNTRDASALWILTMLVGVLLLIVCANVANLLLSRSVSRRRESAVRLALGAARSRLFRQHLIESALFGFLGGAAGLGLGYVLAQSIHQLFESGLDASHAFDLHLDLRVLAYNVVLSLLTALLFGLAPAARSSSADLSDTLKAHAKSVMGDRLRLPKALVSVQIALCLCALVAAGLLGRSLANLRWVDVGFDQNNLAYVSVSPSPAGYPADRVQPYLDRVRGELARLPGVLGVSSVATRPLSGNGNNGRVNFPGRPWDDDSRANLNSVGVGFFDTLRIPLLAGRTFEPRDLGPDAGVAVVDETFATRYFPHENPLGRRFGLDPASNSRYQIVGVVGNSRYNDLRGEAVPTVYEPYRPGGTTHFAIRTTMDSARLAETVRKTVASIDPAVPIGFFTQTALIDRLLRTERLLSYVSGAFGLIALTLAAIGLGGLLAYAVARRTNEIGLRMALGASATGVIRMVLRDSLAVVGRGILIGLPCAFALAWVLRATLFQLEPFDPRTAVLSVLALGTVALIAAWIPASRAARIDPITALREE